MACCAFAVWLWRFWPGSSIGFGSRKQDLVDRIGDMDSIFEKIRAVICALPPEFESLGFSDRDHMNFMKILNQENGRASPARAAMTLAVVDANESISRMRECP